MFVFKNILVSEEILAARFACDLAVCKGACCRGGDAGAPLSDEEVALFRDSAGALAAMPSRVRARVEKYGLVSEAFNRRLDRVCHTVAVDGRGDCVFLEEGADGVWRCHLQASGSSLKKPVSCFLFPIREKRSGEIVILNLYVYDECRPCYGPEKPLLVEFLHPVLASVYGEDLANALAEEARGR